MTVAKSEATVLVGCAGWGAVSRLDAAKLGTGSQLERYARVLDATEINSSFYRPHRQSTYQKWAASVPEHFRFSVKLPKAISHQNKLRGSEGLLAEFLEQAAGLGHKLGYYLLQLPPSLAFDAALLEEFLGLLRGQSAVPTVLEARHRSWFEGVSGEQAGALLQRFQVGRVAADPALVAAAAQPGGDLSCQYYRWHGSPRMYYSAYDEATLQALAARIFALPAAQHTWVIFDNTASRAGIDNALELQKLLRPGPNT